MTEGDLIGQTVTIVGMSTDGAPEQEFVAHICLRMADGRRVFLNATDPHDTWKIEADPS